jgi:diphthine-ammonia ligase
MPDAPKESPTSTKGSQSTNRRVDKAFLKDILDCKDVDPRGENGKYHTLVTHGPLFKQRVEIVEAHKVFRSGYWFLDIREYRPA